MKLKGINPNAIIYYTISKKGDIININKEVTSDNIGKPYSDFNLTITDANKGIIEYYWEG